jgi:excisionase family DNA binding protein
MALTVPQAARRIGRNPETVRRWIREGKLASTKVGTQHLIAEQDLAELVEPTADTAPLPPEWQLTAWGTPMPDVVAAVHRSRQGH